MSALLNFVKSLNPRIRKADAQSEIETTLKELRDYTLPMARSMNEQYKVVPFKSQFSKSFESLVYDHVKFERKSKNVWLDITTALNNVIANTEATKKLIDNVLQEDTLRDGVTARVAHVLRFAGALSFVSRYITEVADYILAQEAVAMGDADETAPAQANYLKNNMEKFARLLADTSIPPKEFDRMMADIPDAYLSDKDAATVTSMFTSKQLDPFTKMAGMSGWINSPVFVIRMMWETYQAERYHAAKDRKAMLELRLIHLQNRQQNENNPRLQREIEGLEARIRKYEQKIRKVEESIA